MSIRLSPVTPLHEAPIEAPIELPAGVLAPRSKVKVRRLTRAFNQGHFLTAEALFAAFRLRNSSLTTQYAYLSGDDFQDLTDGHEPGLAGLISNPRDVHAREQVVEFRQARQWVRSGRLRLEDLIDVGRGWESVGDCLELSAEVDRALRRSRWRNRILLAAVVAANILWPLLFLYGASRVLALLP